MTGGLKWDQDDIFQTFLNREILPLKNSVQAALFRKQLSKEVKELS